MKLNIGSGSKRYPEYLNIDSNIDSNPDFLIDLETENLPFEDNSVDSVLAHHILEHLGVGFFHAVKELYRVCTNNTIIDVKVPHPRHDIFLIDPTHKRPIYPHTLDMFSKERNLFDIKNNGCETPIGLINDVNLAVVDHQFTLDPYWEDKFKLMSNDECEHVARSMNNVITEITIKWKVIK